MTGNILLDTCAAIWIADDAGLSRSALAELDDSLRSRQEVMISPVTAWEVGMLVSRGRYGARMPVQSWFDGMVARPYTALAALNPRILIESSFLPGKPPNDPYDRLFIATARASGYRIMTRDRKILDYADQDHVQAIPC